MLGLLEVSSILFFPNEFESITDRLVHFVALLALSTSHPDPLGALSALWDLTSKEKLFAPSSYLPHSGAEEDNRKEWANPDVLRYIVLVHDFGAGGGRDGWEE